MEALGVGDLRRAGLVRQMGPCLALRWPVCRYLDGHEPVGQRIEPAAGRAWVSIEQTVRLVRPADKSTLELAQELAETYGPLVILPVSVKRPSAAAAAALEARLHRATALWFHDDATDVDQPMLILSRASAPSRTG